MERKMSDLKERLNATVAYLQDKIGDNIPEIALVLGSGLGDFGDELRDVITIPYKDIPHFPVSTAPGHKSRLIIGNIGGKRVVCMQGRFHYYEGYSLQEVVYPIQTFKMLHINNLVLTNAAGCTNEAWNVGDLMLITDHLKLQMGSPLRGENPDFLGPRFFDMGNTYDSDLRSLTLNIAKKQGLTLREGVYAYSTGPNFETPAEVRAYRMLGADAVGMSTVPEAIVASHMGLRTVGISCMTNMAAGIGDSKLDQDEVIVAGKKVKPQFTALLTSLIAEWK